MITCNLLLLLRWLLWLSLDSRRQLWLRINFNGATCVGHENLAFMAVYILTDLAFMMQIVFIYLFVVLLNARKS